MATTQYIRYPGSGASSGVTSLNGLTGGLTLVAGTGISITPSGSNITIANTEAGGTVTSVALSLPSIFTVTGSPVTTSGTLTGTFNTQSANTVFAGPASGVAATPTFRALVTADLPAGTGTVTAVTATAPITSTGGTTPNIAVNSGNLTDAGTDGIVVTNGTGAVLGTGTSLAQHVADTTHNGYLASTDWNTFNNKQPAGNYITALTGDVTASGPGSAAASLVATTNATLTTLSSLSLPFTQTTGTVPIARGGTGQVTAAAAYNALSPMTTTGDIEYEASANTAARLPIGSTGQVLTVASGIPSWATPTTGVQAGTLDNENATFSPTIATNQLTLTLQTLSGATPSSGSPCTFAFRGTGLTSTTYTLHSATAATALTLPSTASLGIYDSANHYVYFYAIYTSAGGVEAGVSAQQLDEGLLYNTQATSGATSNQPLYSTTSRSSAAIKLIGRVAIAYSVGTGWANSPSEISCVPFYPGVIAARATGSTTTITSSATLVVNPTVTFDPASCYSTSTGQFTAPVKGYYRVSTTCRLSAVGFTANEVLELYVFQNGSQYSILDRLVIEDSVNNLLSLQGSDTLLLNVGGTADVRMLQQSGTNTPLDASTFVSFEYIGGV